MTDISTVVVEGGIKMAMEVARDIVNFAKAGGQRELGKLLVDLEFGFKEYLSRAYRRHSKVRTLINPNRPTSIESAFESPLLELDDDTNLTEDDFLRLLEADHFTVITGTGGSGKSFFLKHLFIRYYNEARGKIPILAELRTLPADTDLQSYLHSLVVAVVPSLTAEMFEHALRSGKFALLLDGFDEVDFTARRALSEQIIRLTYACGDNLVVLSSRPDETFQGWNEFHVLRMKDFTKQQVLSLVKKVRYSKDVKRKFTDLIRSGGLYDSHRSYLFNPLLCTIMLLTFDHGADIPTKMHLFFGQTFDVLFYRHDATKGAGFRRKFHTTLTIDQFRSAFSAFSAFSYMEYGPTLKQPAAIASAQTALEYFRI